MRSVITRVECVNFRVTRAVTLRSVTTNAPYITALHVSMEYRWLRGPRDWSAKAIVLTHVKDTHLEEIHAQSKVTFVLRRVSATLTSVVMSVALQSVSMGVGLKS